METIITILNRFAYVGCALYAVFIFYNARITKEKSINLTFSKGAKTFLLLILVVYWTLLLGLQDNVGTDYPNYYRYFDTGDTGLFYRNKEYGFLIIANFIARCNWDPQVGFIIFSCIESLCFVAFLLQMRIEKIELFLFIYFCCGTSFINSQNALRQYAAMYVFLLAIHYLIKKASLKNIIMFVIVVIVASLFHRSAILLLTFYLVKPLLKVNNKRIWMLALIISIVICVKGIDTLVVAFVRNTPYKSYLDSAYFLEGNRRNMVNIITKLIYVPFYFHYLMRGYSELRNDRYKYLVNIGYICFCFKIMSMSSFFLARFALYFDCLGYIPLYFYFRWLLENNKMHNGNRILVLLIFVCIIVGPFMLKTLAFPKNEYLYKSIILK